MKNALSSLFTLVLFTLLLLILPDVSAQPDDKNNLVHLPLRIAVSSNFAPVLKLLLVEFNRRTGINTQVISASSGTLFLQIKYGAPFDVFLSADAVRPRQLEADGFTVEHTLKTYAYGQLALFSTKQSQSVSLSLMDLSNTKQRIAIANPQLAPYGIAAKQTLQYLGLWQKVQSRLIRGVNINQTFQQTRSQAVSMGLVAYSQLVINNLAGTLIPKDHHQPIKQQMVVLKQPNRSMKAHNNIVAFSEFIMNKQTQQKIVSFGYLAARSQLVHATE